MRFDHEQPIPRVLKSDNWPPQDLMAWGRLFEEGDIFDEAGACRHWSEGTRRFRRQGYGQWLSFIVREHPELLPLEPSARVTQEVVMRFIEESRARLKTRSVSGLINSLASVVQAMVPKQDLRWLWRAGDRLYQQSNPHALKPRLPLSASDIFHWSLKRMAQLEHQDSKNLLVRATQFRQALMIGLLIARPVRARAFCNMRLGRHIKLVSGRYHLYFYPEDMKDKRARVYPLPDRLAASMERYLIKYRPVLERGRGSDALWISQTGKALSQDSFTSGLASLTRRHLGVTLRSHAFRHISATSIAEEDPTHVGIISDILGHAGLEMSELHYNRAGTRTASAQLQEMMRDIRRESRKSRRGRTDLPNRRQTETGHRRYFRSPKPEC